MIGLLNLREECNKPMQWFTWSPCTIYVRSIHYSWLSGELNQWSLAIDCWTSGHRYLDHVEEYVDERQSSTRTWLKIRDASKSYFFPTSWPVLIANKGSSHKHAQARLRPSEMTTAFMIKTMTSSPATFICTPCGSITGTRMARGNQLTSLSSATQLPIVLR